MELQSKKKRNKKLVGLTIMLIGVIMFVLSMAIFMAQSGQIESGFFGGVLNGMFFSGILWTPIGLIIFLYGLVTERRHKR